MATETTEAVRMDADALDFEVAETGALADLAAATGDRGLTKALRLAAERITSTTEMEAIYLREQARSRRAEAAKTYATASELVLKANEEGQLAELAVEEVSDEGLRHHLDGIVAFEDARRAKAIEWLERAQEILKTASLAATELERRAECTLRDAQARPEVIAWRRLTAECLDQIEHARSATSIDGALREAEGQGLIDERLRKAAVQRKRRLGELAQQTRETVKLWARYAPGGDGLHPPLTLRGTALLAAAGPGTIFEVGADGRKLAVHRSDDGLVWVRRRAGGRFKPRGATMSRIERPARPTPANGGRLPRSEETCSSS
ncbi:MAG: hypothetical protein V3U86_08225 [Acidobacteriota bacterium]